MTTQEKITEQTQIKFFNSANYAGCTINGEHFPIKNINTPDSRFSKARYLKSLPNKDFKIEIEKGVHGEIMYYKFNNTMMIPEYNNSNRLIY